jgi:hypothetical protein
VADAGHDDFADAVGVGQEEQRGVLDSLPGVDIGDVALLLLVG